MKLLYSLLLLLWCLFDHGFPWVVSDEVSVMEGDSVTLNTDFELKHEEDIKWYFNDICIAQNSEDQKKSKICTDVQCEDSNGRFRDRLDLNCQTGSLTVTKTRTTDSGVYQLEIISSSIRENTFIVTVHDASGVETDRVSVMEGDSVTLNTGVQTNQQDRIRWYYNDTRIAQINRDLSKICTDVQCKGGDERFRDRLKLDHQTGSLTIMNITDTDAGVYQLLITSDRSDNETIYIVAVQGVSAAERHEVKRKTVKEGESVALESDVKRNPKDVMTWYFNDTLIAEITGDQSKICTDVQCKERFRDRLKLDHQTGSLIIKDTTTEDSGLYQLKIIRLRRRRSISTVQGFDVTVTADPGSGLSAGAVAGISVAVLLLVFVAAAVTVGVIYSRYRSSSNGMIFKTVMELKQLKAPVESPISKMEKDGGNDRGNVI